MGYLSQLEEVEECESTENDLDKNMEEKVLHSRTEIKLLNYYLQEEKQGDEQSMSSLLSILKLQLKEVCILLK